MFRSCTHSVDVWGHVKELDVHGVFEVDGSGSSGSRFVDVRGHGKELDVHGVFGGRR